MAGMFNNCYKLEKIEGINKFVTKNVESMTLMFNECKELEYLDLSNFNTSNLFKMKFMLRDCCKLEEIKGIEKFIINNVDSIYELFDLFTDPEVLYSPDIYRSIFGDYTYNNSI